MVTSSYKIIGYGYQTGYQDKDVCYIEKGRSSFSGPSLIILSLILIFGHYATLDDQHTVMHLLNGSAKC